MSERSIFDSDTMIVAALAKCGKVTLTADECRAAKKLTIIVDHDEPSVRVVSKEDSDRWAKPQPARGLSRSSRRSNGKD